MSHCSLAEVQRQLQDFLLDKPSQAMSLTLETPAFSRSERLEVYHQAYRLRLIDALRNDFPALESYVGSEAFADLCEAYITVNPSRHTSLRWLGERMPAFLREHEKTRANIVLAELAEFEWSQIMAFDAADEAPITVGALASLPPEQWASLTLIFHASLQAFAFYSNVPSLWHALIKEHKLINVEVDNETSDWLVWREHMQVVYRRLERAETEALQLFLKRHDFAAVCEVLCQSIEPEHVPLRAARYLQGWILAGLVTAIDVTT